MKPVFFFALTLLLLTACGEGPAPDLPGDNDEGFPSEAPLLMPLEVGNQWYYEHTVHEDVDTLEVLGLGYIRGEEFMEVLSFEVEWVGGPTYGRATHFWRYTDSSLVKLDRGLGVSGFVELEYVFPELAGEEPWPIEDLSGGQYSYYTELYSADTTVVTPLGEIQAIVYRSFRENAHEEGAVDAYWLDYFAENIGWVGRSYETEEGHSAWLEGYALVD